MAVEPPSRIAILGAGPIGLEAALYARYLGYDITIYERGSVAENVLRWGHVTMFTPFAMNCSRLGRAAIEAQSPHYVLPAEDSLTTGALWAESYLARLAQTDLVGDALRLHSTIEFIGRDGLLKTDSPGSPTRAEVPFQILVRDVEGCSRWETAEIVLDTTGTYGNHNWMGPGGIPAIGEVACAPHIEYNVPDVQHSARDNFAGEHTLLIGAGYSAATTAVALAELSRDAPDTRVTWITRQRWNVLAGDGPIRQITDDRLAQRQHLTVEANRLAQQSDQMKYCPRSTVLEVSRDDAQRQFAVVLVGKLSGCHTFDRIIANVGYKPDRNLYRELQVHECYASEAPMKLAAAMLSHSSHDCLDQRSHGAERVLNPEPNFFILGSKSHGRGSQFLFQSGLTQIRDTFSIILGRDDLDLYDSVQNV